MYDEEDGTKANGIEFLKIGIGNKNGKKFSYFMLIFDEIIQILNILLSG